MSCDDSNATMSILTLGDGDFTYSLDLARFLALDGTHNWNLICTGIDTREELLAKYRDTPFVLNQLQSLTSARLKISFHHSVNAILDPSHNDNGTSTQGMRSQHPTVDCEKIWYELPVELLGVLQ